MKDLTLERKEELWADAPTFVPNQTERMRHCSLLSYDTPELYLDGVIYAVLLEDPHFGADADGNRGIFVTWIEEWSFDARELFIADPQHSERISYHDAPADLQEKALNKIKELLDGMDFAPVR